MPASRKSGTRAMETSARLTRKTVDDKVGRFVVLANQSDNFSRDESKLTDVVYEYERRGDSSIREDGSSLDRCSQSHEISQRDAVPTNSSIHQDESTQHYDKIYEQIFGPDSPRHHIGDTGTSHESSCGTDDTASDGASPLDTAMMSMEDTIYEEVPKDEDEKYNVGCLESFFLPAKDGYEGFSLNPIRCERVGPNKTEVRISLALNYPSEVLDSLPSHKELRSAFQDIRCSSTANQQKSDNGGVCHPCNSEDDRSLDMTYFPTPDYADPSAPVDRSLFVSPSDSSSEGDAASTHSDGDGDSAREDAATEQVKEQEEEKVPEPDPEFYDEDRYYDNEEDDREHILSLNSFIPFDAPSRGKSSCSRSKGRSRAPSSHSSKPPSTISSAGGLNLFHAQPASLKEGTTGSFEVVPVPQGSTGKGGRSKSCLRRKAEAKINSADTVDELMGRETPDHYAVQELERKSASSSRTHASDETGNPPRLSSKALASSKVQATTQVCTSKVSTRNRFKPPQLMAPSFDEDPYPSFDELSKGIQPQLKTDDELMGCQKKVTPLVTSCKEVRNRESVCATKRLDPTVNSDCGGAPTSTIDELMGAPPTTSTPRASFRHPRQAKESAQRIDQHITSEHYDTSTVDTSLNGAHDVPVIIQYLEGRAASSLDETDLEDARLPIGGAASRGEKTPPRSVVDGKACGTYTRSMDNLTSMKFNKTPERPQQSSKESLSFHDARQKRYERLRSSFQESRVTSGLGLGRSEPMNASTRDTPRFSGFGVDAIERKDRSFKETKDSSHFDKKSNDIAPSSYRLPQPSSELDCETPATWKDFICSPPRNLHGASEGDAKAPGRHDGCPSDESKTRDREEDLSNEDDPLILARTVPHFGTTESVPHIETPTDSAIWSTVDRLLAGRGWEINQEDQAMAPVHEASSQQKTLAELDLTNVYPAVFEMAEKFLHQEAARYISAALQLLRSHYNLEFTVPLKSTSITIELLDDEKLNGISVEVNNCNVGSEGEENRLVCRDGIAPLEGAIPLANLDDLLYPSGAENADTVDFVKIINKFAGAHPYCLPASIDHIFASRDGETDSQETNALEGQISRDIQSFELDFVLLQRILDEIPLLLRSGESFQCRHLYLMAWAYTRMLSTAMTWWDTWNTPWTQPRYMDEDEEDLYEG